MSEQVIQILIVALSTLVAPLLPTLVTRLMRRGKATVEKGAVSSYRKRMTALNRSLAESAGEVDRALKEMSDVSQERERAIYELETKLKELVEREQHLQAKVDSLEKVPLPAIEHFISEIEKAERRSAWRDYKLFSLGVIVSTVITIALKVIWGV
jgi:hypothetical protein